MNCEKCKELMWDYLSNELKAEDAAQVAEHLESCQECQSEAKKVQEIMDFLTTLPEEELPEGYHVELMNKLGREKSVVPMLSVKKKKYIWKQLSVIAAGIVLVAVVGGTQGILKMRGGHEAPVQRMAAQGDKEIQDIVQAEPPQEEDDTLQEHEIFEESADTGAVKVRSVPQQKIGNESVKQKEETSPKEAKVEESVEGEAEMQRKESPPVDVGVQAKMSAQADQPQERGFLFSADTAVEETQVQQVILSVDTPEGVLDSIRDLAISLGGYEENRPSEDSIKLFIPSDYADKFMEGLKNLGEIRSILENLDNIELIPFEVTLEID